MRWVVWLLGILTFAGIIHISTILIIPQIAPNDAWSRISEKVSEGEFVVLPRSKPGEETLPLMDPAVVYAICRYNLESGAISIETELPTTFWSVAAHTRSGVVFYSVTGQASPKGNIRIDLRNHEQMREVLLGETDEEDEKLTILAEEDEGFLLFRGLVSAASEAEIIGDIISKTSCATIEE